jgi:hypothetical protein
MGEPILYELGPKGLDGAGAVGFLLDLDDFG